MIAEHEFTGENRTACLKYAGRILHNPADAEDVVQSAFMKAWRNRERFRGDCSTRSFLVTCTHYQCIEFIRNEKTRNKHLSSLFSADVIDFGFDPRVDKALIAQETIDRLSNVARIHRRWPAVFDLMCFGYESGEISRLLGMNDNTVKVMIHRIRETARGLRA